MDPFESWGDLDGRPAYCDGVLTVPCGEGFVRLLGRTPANRDEPFEAARVLICLPELRVDVRLAQMDPDFPSLPRVLEAMRDQFSSERPSTFASCVASADLYVHGQVDSLGHVAIDFRVHRSWVEFSPADWPTWSATASTHTELAGLEFLISASQTFWGRCPTW